MIAKDLVAGMTFTDHMGHTHTVESVDRTAGGTAAGIYVHVTGQGHPEFYLNDQRVVLVETDHVAHSRDLAVRYTKELAEAIRYGYDRGERGEIQTLVRWDEFNLETGAARRLKREYLTTGGLLRALIRLASDPYRYSIIDVF